MKRLRGNLKIVNSSLETSMECILLHQSSSLEYFKDFINEDLRKSKKEFERKVIAKANSFNGPLWDIDRLKVDGGRVIMKELRDTFLKKFGGYFEIYEGFSLDCPTDKYFTIYGFNKKRRKMQPMKVVLRKYDYEEEKIFEKESSFAISKKGEFNCEDVVKAKEELRDPEDCYDYDFPEIILPNFFKDPQLIRDIRNKIHMNILSEDEYAMNDFI